MVTDQLISAAVRTLVQESDPERILLFGSHARGDAGDESDVDLLVVLPEVTSRRSEMVRLRRSLLPLRIPVDILVVSAADYEKWSAAPGTTLYWAKREGKVLYEAA